MSGHCHRRHHAGIGLLGAGLLALLPLAAVAVLIGALGWWSLALLGAAAFLWGCVQYCHKREHMPGHTGTDDNCGICKRWHQARFVQLKSDETERRHQADYERMVAEEEDGR